MSPGGRIVEYTVNAPNDNAFQQPLVADTPMPATEYRYFEGENVAAPRDNLETFLDSLELSNFERATNNWQMPGDEVPAWPEASHLQPQYNEQAVLEERTFDLREKLRFTAASMTAPNPPAQELLDAIECITAHMLANNISLYFRHWHKHAPMVHEGSFVSRTAALPLLLAMCSLGGMVSAEYILWKTRNHVDSFSTPKIQQT